MKKSDLVEVSIKHIMPAANGCAVFLGDDSKNFVIYVDHFIGGVIQLALDGAKTERPLTHQLIANILLGLGAKIERVLINDAKESAFFARLRLCMENELGKKILDLDARPSDCIVLALQHKLPILVARAVFDAVEDMTEVLERVLKLQKDSPGGDGLDLPLFPTIPGKDDDDEDDDEDEDEEDEDEDDD